jgi:hypothetical protein
MKAQNGEQISVAAKWMPSINSSSPETKRYGRILQQGFGVTERQYRKNLSYLRKYLDVVERKMSAKKWPEIRYEAVPSKANLIYNNAFLKNDEERRRAYLDSLSKGETKINAGQLQPHEIVNRYVGVLSWRSRVDEYNETLEQLWKNLPTYSLSNTLVVRDGSGSMISGYSTKVKQLDVATALAVYMSERNTGCWKDKFITFSRRPQFIDLSECETLRDKLVATYAHDECENTNVKATMDLVLQTAIQNHCSQEDMPGAVLILSDLQFDGACSQRPNKTLFESIAEEFEEHGYRMPRIIFWNLSGSVNNTVPMQKNDMGVILMSGFSVQLLKMVMSNRTDPYEVLLDTINDRRYDVVEEALKKAV